MTVVPLPDTPCVRARVIWTPGGALDAGSRFYLSYSGSAPSGGNCNTLASDISSAWGTHMAPMVTAQDTLTEVDVVDIATRTGASGTWTGTVAGSRGGSPLSNNCATNVEHDIARRYRGGKPRMFWPPGCEADLFSQSTWDSTYINAMNSAVAAFFSEIEALSVGSMGTLQHVNLSYYEGFSNHTNTSGRSKAVPTYRPTALHDNILGYATKALIGSQRRRRTSTTP